MSEHENTSGGTERMSPVLTVETAPNKNTILTQRPTDLRDEGAPDLYQKRAPAVASTVNEKLKASVENTDNKDMKENENAISAERQKYVAKNLSSNISSKRRGSSPAVIPMAPIEPASKQYETMSLSVTTQPIPSPTAPVPSKPHVGGKKDEVDRKADEESITSEIVEMRTPEVAKKTPEWEDESNIILDHVYEKNQETIPIQEILEVGVLNESVLEASTCADVKKSSWESEAYLEKVKLQNFNQETPMRPYSKRSILFKKTGSGITISLPKKSLNNIIYISDDCYTKSGINITVSKRCIDNKSKSFNEFEEMRRDTRNEVNMHNELQNERKTKETGAKYYTYLRSKMESLRERIKHALHISV